MGDVGWREKYVRLGEEKITQAVNQILTRTSSGSQAVAANQILDEIEGLKKQVRGLSDKVESLQKSLEEFTRKT